MTKNRATRFGKPLPAGGTIGVPATSNPYHNRSDVYRAVEWWEGNGYRVKLAEGIWDVDDYVAGSPQGRAKDLMAMFTDPEMDLVLPCGAGTGRRTCSPTWTSSRSRTTPSPSSATPTSRPSIHPGSSTWTAASGSSRTWTLRPGTSTGCSGSSPRLESWTAWPAWSSERWTSATGGRIAAEASRTKSLEDVLEMHLEPLRVPVLYKPLLGHGKHLATLPLG